nr:MAG TPA: hypothetical protein [Caudoviricetes sp.]
MLLFCICPFCCCVFVACMFILAHDTQKSRATFAEHAFL